MDDRNLLEWQIGGTGYLGVFSYMRKFVATGSIAKPRGMYEIVSDG